MARRSSRSTSAGILLYRRAGDDCEVLLVHPGGPFWQNKDAGAWQIPKGGVEAGEAPAAAAAREFGEELGVPLGYALTPLGSFRQAGGKLVHLFIAEGNLDVTQVRSNLIELEWPPRSGRLRSVPEIDRAQWFGLAAAHAMILPSQRVALDRLEQHLC
jgi:predicted NUDIX family NTP pyrophosphohydrolase